MKCCSGEIPCEKGVTIPFLLENIYFLFVHLKRDEENIQKYSLSGMTPPHLVYRKRLVGSTFFAEASMDTFSILCLLNTMATTIVLWVCWMLTESAAQCIGPNGNIWSKYKHLEISKY